MLYTLQNIISPTTFFNELKKKITLKDVALSQIKINKSLPLYRKIYRKVQRKEEEVHFDLVQEYHRTNVVTRRAVTQGMMIELMYQAILLIQICVALQERGKILIDLPISLNKQVNSGDLLSCVLSPKGKAIFYELGYQMIEKRGKYGMSLKFERIVGRTTKIYFEKPVKDLDQMIDVMFTVIDECLNLFEIKEQPAGKKILARGNTDLRKGVPPIKTLKLIKKLFKHNRYYFSDDLPTNTYSYNIIKEFLNNRLKK